MKNFKKLSMYDENIETIASDGTGPLPVLNNVISGEAVEDKMHPSGQCVLVLPTEEELYQWAIKKAHGFERETLARQCFFEGAKYWVNRIAEEMVGKTC